MENRFAFKKLASANISTQPHSLSNIDQDRCNRICGTGKRCIFMCPFCRDTITNPCTLSCGHTFCYKCLLQLNAKQVLSCPVCFHGSLEHVDTIHVNLLLFHALESLRKASLVRLEIHEKTCNPGISVDMDGTTCEPKSVSSNESNYDNSVTETSALIETIKKKLKSCMYAEALQAAEGLRKYRPCLCESHYWLGICLYRVGRLSEALDALFGAMQLDPFDTVVEQTIQKLLHNNASPTTLSPTDFMSSNDSGFAHLDHDNDAFDLLSFTSPTSTFLPTNEHMASSSTDSFPMHPHFFNLASLSSTSSHSSKGSPTIHDPVTAPENRITQSSMDIKKSTRIRMDGRLDWMPIYSPNASTKNSDTGNQYKRKLSSMGERPVSRIDHVQPSLSTGCECVYQLLPFMNPEDFDCSLCYCILYRPVTTPCGHTFCRPCLQRALDHRLKCPLCNSDIDVHFHSGILNVCQLLEELVIAAFPTLYAKHRDEHIADIAKFTQKDASGASLVPVMVCTLALPGVPCPLEISGPRYRAMVRLALESGTRKFAMAISLQQHNQGQDINETNISEEKAYADVVTLLDIKSMKLTDDGRYILDTVGTRRCRILERGIHNGFPVAKMIPFGDKPLDLEDMRPVRQLCHRVHDLADAWFHRQSGYIRQKITSHWGPLPEAQPDILGTSENGPAWHWWIISVLPVQENIKYRLFCTQSVVQRLSILARCLLQINMLEERCPQTLSNDAAENAATES